MFTRHSELSTSATLLTVLRHQLAKQAGFWQGNSPVPFTWTREYIAQDPSPGHVNTLLRTLHLDTWIHCLEPFTWTREYIAQDPSLGHVNTYIAQDPSPGLHKHCPGPFTFTREYIAQDPSSGQANIYCPGPFTFTCIKLPQTLLLDTWIMSNPHPLYVQIYIA
jgi:hypothetical protein